MDSQERKKVNIITSFAIEFFSESDWYSLGQLTGALPVIQGHSRLLRSLSFGDDDYVSCVAEVLNEIFVRSPETIDGVIDNYDIDVWYEQKDPRKYRKLFLEDSLRPPDFWKEGYLKAFVSHLFSGKQRVSQLKGFLDQWGISAFVAHEDIKPSREWQKEIEVALDTMDVMIAVVEPGFKESDWCCQEVGFALGRKVEILSLRSNLDPFGLFGKYQGIQVKSKLPSRVAEELTNILLRKPKYRNQLLISISKSVTLAPPQGKLNKIRLLDSWGAITDEQMKNFLERVALSDSERAELSEIILRVKAFEGTDPNPVDPDDFPF